jgi:glutamate 5-kinase
MELTDLKQYKDHVVECIDNDETASVISDLVKSRLLVILTSVNGIYADPTDPSTIIREIGGKDIYEVIENITAAQANCTGSSRKWSNGAYAKLEYIKAPVQNGTKVIIAHAKNRLSDIINGKVECTVIGAR